MRKILFVIPLVLILSKNTIAQYKNDNKLYRTIYWDELCRELQKQDGHLLLDVRSKGEFCDTSIYAGLNIGHLKGATNIDIHQLPDSINKLDAYKDKPIYVYCSHSQRSRRVSKLLSEKGFKNVININGGMTIFNDLKNSEILCQQSIFETNVPYTILSPLAVCNLLKDDKNVFILDVRKDSAFKSISTDEEDNAYGKFRQSVNIPVNTIADALDKIPSNKIILIVDAHGNQSPKAARLLIEKGYKNVNVLFNGMENWSSIDPALIPCKNQLTVRSNAYQLLTAEEFNELAVKNTELLILDIRKDSSFNNKAKDSWRNIGQIKQAINIPSDELNEKLDQIEKFKNKPVILYDFSSSTEVFSSAKLLAAKGFSKLYVLSSGLFNLRWMAANIKDHQYLNSWVINIPEENY